MTSHSGEGGPPAFEKDWGKNKASNQAKASWGIQFVAIGLL
jgi:hypothetical protein